MGRKGVICIWALIAALLLTEYGAKGQGEVVEPARETTTLRPQTTTGPPQTTTAAPMIAAAAAETTTGAAQTTTGAAQTTTGAAQTTTAAPMIAAAETTTGAAQTTTGAAQTTTAAPMIAAAETTTGAAQTTTGAAQTTTGAAQTTTGAAQTTTAAPMIAAAETTTGAAQTTTGAAQTTTAAPMIAAAETTTGAAQTTTGAAQTTTAAPMIAAAETTTGAAQTTTAAAQTTTGAAQTTTAAPMIAAAETTTGAAQTTTGAPMIAAAETTTAAAQTTTGALVFKSTSTVEVKTSKDTTSELGSMTEEGLTKYIENTNSFQNPETAAPVIEVLNKKEIRYVYDVLIAIDLSELDNSVLSMLLLPTVEKVQSTSDPLCSVKYEGFFKEKKTSILLKGLTTDIAKKMAPKDCMDFHYLCHFLDMYDAEYTDEVKQSVHKLKLDFLTAQKSQSGSACAHGLSSEEWLKKSIGTSLSLFSLNTLLDLNPYLDGFVVMKILNMNQTTDLIKASGLFNSASPENYKEHTEALVTVLKEKGYSFCLTFLKQMSSSYPTIANWEVQEQVIEVALKVLHNEFPEEKPADVLSEWFIKALPICLPAITAGQLSLLSYAAVGGCPGMKILVGGCNKVYMYMSSEARQNIANYIQTFVKEAQNKCMSDNPLIDNFQRFVSYADMEVMYKIYPELRVTPILSVLSESQLADVLINEPEGLSNVTLSKAVFMEMKKRPDYIVKLLTFWHTFNEKLEKAIRMTVDVQMVMLGETLEAISPILITEARCSVWMEELRNVIMVIDKEMLDKLPEEMDCDARKVLIKALSINRAKATSTSMTDVFAYISNSANKNMDCSNKEPDTMTYIENMWGNYSDDAAYIQLYNGYDGFDPMAILPIFSASQMGYMMAASGVYNSEENATKVMAVLKTYSVENTDISMMTFMETAKQQGIMFENVNAGQIILGEYLSIKNNDLIKYNGTQKKEFLQKNIPFLLRFLTKKNLDSFDADNCDTLEDMIEPLNDEYDSMPDETKTTITEWIMGHLQSKNLNGCTRTSEPSEVWANRLGKKFFGGFSLDSVEQVNSEFEPLSVTHLMSTKQKAQCFAGSDVAQDVNKTRIVLESLKGPDGKVAVKEMYNFLSSCNEYFIQMTFQIMPKVREECMKYFFGYFMENIYSMKKEMISQFGEMFKLFLGGTTVESLRMIPMNMPCQAYPGVFSAISSASEDLSEDIRKATAKTMLDYLVAQKSGSSDSCGNMYTSSAVFLQMLYNFKKYFTIRQMQGIYRKFNAFEVLEMSTAKQMGELFIISNAKTDVLQASQIMLQLKSRTYPEIRDFMTESTTVAKQENITALPNENVAGLLAETVTGMISDNLTSPEEITFWFDEGLNIIMPYISKDFMATLSASDCQSQKSVVSALSEVSDEMSEVLKKAVCQQIEEFNLKTISTTGSACGMESGNSDLWLNTYMAKFKSDFKLSDIIKQCPTFDVSQALGSLTGDQAADAALQTGALVNSEKMANISRSITTKENMDNFLMKIISLAEAIDLIILVEVKSTITKEAFEFYNKHPRGFSTFSEAEWSGFATSMQNIIYTITEPQLMLLPLMSCSNYQIMLKCLDSAFLEMPEATRKSVFVSFIKPQMKNAPAQNGVRCGQSTDSSGKWLRANFGRFASYGDLPDFSEWKTNFQPTTVIKNLSPTQLATVAMQNIDNNTLICTIMGKVSASTVQEATEFFTTFVGAMESSSVRISSEIGSKILLTYLTSTKPDTVAYNTTDEWNLYYEKMHNFWTHITTETTELVFKDADCNRYTAAVKQLSASHSAYSKETKMNVAEALTNTLQKLASPSGPCPMDGESSMQTVERLLGSIRFEMPYDKMISLLQFPAGAGMDIITMLLPEQKAELAFAENVFADEDKAKAYTDNVKLMNSEQSYKCLLQLHAITVQKGIDPYPNPEIRSWMMAAFYGTLAPDFPLFTLEQWTGSWNSFGSLLDSLTEEQVWLIPDNIPCSHLHIVTDSCSKRFAWMSSSAQEAMLKKIISILESKSVASGPPCPTSPGDSGNWLNTNFAAFGEMASITIYENLYPNFDAATAVSYLTADQLGYHMANLEVISDKKKMLRIMSGINGDNLREFMGSFNAACEKAGITSIDNEHFMQEIFCKFGSISSLLTLSDYTSWMKQFTLFGSFFDAKTLGFFKVSSCEILEVIMKTLNQAKTPKHPKAVSNFAINSLTNLQTSPGMACTSDEVDTKTWVNKNLGPYLPYAEYPVLNSLNKKFNPIEVLDLLSEKQKALASSSSSFISNTESMASMISSFNGNLESLLPYTMSLRTSFIENPSLSSNKVLINVMDPVTDLVFYKFTSMSLEDTQKWSDTLSFGRSVINAKMLDKISPSISCPQYQVLGSWLDGAYSGYNPKQKTDIGGFKKKILNSQLENTGEACTMQNSNPLIWMMNFVGQSCDQFTYDEIKIFNPAVSEVSFQLYCGKPITTEMVANNGIA